MAEHGLAQQGGRFNILYAEHRTEKTNFDNITLCEQGHRVFVTEEEENENRL
jgi:hypothetical protein